MRLMTLVIMSLIFVLRGCNAEEPLSANASIAKDFFENSGYDINSVMKEESFIIQEDDLSDPGFQQILAVQDLDLTSYLDKEIDVVQFDVEGHPLEEHFNKMTTVVTIYLDEGEVIGGWSFPNDPQNAMVGAVYSIDGRTQEEVQAGK